MSFDTNTKMEITYWGDIRGRATEFRYMVAYAKADVKFNYFSINKGAEGFAEWLQEKAQYAVDYPLINLPFLKESNGRIISETSAIVHHLARKFGFHPKTENEQINYDMMFNQATELNDLFFQVIMQKEPGQEKSRWAKHVLPEKLEPLDKWLDLRNNLEKIQ